VATIRQVFALSQLVERRYAALVLLAAFTGLRWGELVALRRSDLDLERGTVTVFRKFAELQDGRRVTGPPKSTAGVRTVALPAIIVDVMKAHLVDFPAERNELVFRGRWVRSSRLGCAFGLTSSHRKAPSSTLA
jgi:integrase